MFGQSGRCQDGASQKHGAPHNETGDAITYMNVFPYLFWFKWTWLRLWFTLGNYGVPARGRNGLESDRPHFRAWLSGFPCFPWSLPALPSASHRILQGMPNSTSLVVALFPRLMAGYFAESRIVTKLITTWSQANKMTSTLAQSDPKLECRSPNSWPHTCFKPIRNWHQTESNMQGDR